ncbi:radical SAM protein [Candidatus Bathyarchaeota archaeon]|nr:radical SAM protein [Candidatus Bathyarchaeota archaeon]
MPCTFGRYILERRKMKPHVTLVNPPAPSGSTGHMPFALLGLGYLGAILEKNRYEVDVIDCQVLKLSYKDFRIEIGKHRPDIVGLTSTTLTYLSALRLARIVKEVLPECLIFIGGPHVTFWDKEALEECPALEVIIRREGEYTLLELVQKVEEGKDFSDVLGITYRKEGKIVKNPDRPYIEDLDSLPFPARHLWPMEKLRKYEDILYLAASRGCVFWCEFCATVRMHGRKFRMRSPKNIVDELEFLYKTYGITNFTFCDDAFTVDPERTKELCKLIIERNLKIKWNCGTRIDMLTRDLLISMREAGCVSVWSGVESGSQTVLDAMHKGITTEQTLRVYCWIRELGLKPVPNVILGFPGETKESAWETIKFVEKISPDEVGFYNIATPFPGTPLYDSVKEKGWLRVTDFDKYDTVTPIFETPWLSMEELRHIRGQAFHHFYMRPTYIVRMFRKGWMYGFAALRTAMAHFIMSTKSKFKRS